MRTIPFMLILSLACSLGSAQSRDGSLPVHNSSFIFNGVTSEWSADSLGGTGYRSKIFDQLSKSKVDQVSTENVLSALGRPSIIRESLNGQTVHVEYLYYLVNINIYKQREKFEMPYLVLTFKKSDFKLIGILQDYLCW